ncbi:MAG: hypothetical protein Q9165_002206 [Trypethelium subeluteriae]
MAPQCQAINLSDEQQCAASAVNSEGLFCEFHARQCFALYRGYKRRNARFDELNSKPPKYLSQCKTALINNTFSDIDDEAVLKELHDYLFHKHALLDRVIRARNLHHARFYSMSMDYGHQAYLDKLNNDRKTTLRALESIERRLVEVIYKQQKWVDWVRQCQDEEDQQKDNEKQKIKKDAALFKKHQKEIDTRREQTKKVELAMMQDRFLDQAYQERVAEMSEDELSKWDPIEDFIENERSSFVDIVKRLLWLEDGVAGGGSQPRDNDVTSNKKGTEADTENITSRERGSPQAQSEGKNAVSLDPKSAKKQAKKARQKLAKVANEPPKDRLLPNVSKATSFMDESKQDVQKRLLKGQIYNPLAVLDYNSMGGGLLVGGIERPHGMLEKTVQLPQEEVDLLIRDIKEIRKLIFCRKLLSFSTLLPLALEAESVEGFLANNEVSSAGLRALCLHLEQPSLQELRDACADLARGNDDDQDEDRHVDWDDVDDSDRHLHFGDFRPRNRKLPKKWISKKEKADKKSRLDRDHAADASASGKGKSLDFGTIDNRILPSQKMKIKVCGRSIWNYPSERSMARSGWFHWAIMAKDCGLADAIKLCRNWNEFYELNILAIFGYFPSPHYARWAGDHRRQQWLQWGAIPHFQYIDSSKNTEYHQTGGRSHQGRFHALAETRNLVAINMNRNDPLTRRFIKYLCMQTSVLFVLVRDATNGQIIVQPPDEELWLQREKFGPGRASRNKWRVIKEVGSKLFEDLDSRRDWRFSFNSYYDILMWDNEPGRTFDALYSVVTNMLIKAHRFREGRADLWSPAAHILRTLTRDEGSQRVRDIKREETTQSVWDEINTPDAKFYYGIKLNSEVPPRGILYDEVDALEDSILFDEEARKNGGSLVKTKLNSISHWEEKGPDMNRLINDMNSDEDSSDGYDEENFANDEHSPDMSLSEEADVRLNEIYDEFVKTDPMGAKLMASLAQRHRTETDDLLDSLVDKDLEDFPRPSFDPEAHFFAHKDRQQSHAFKPAWHRADLEPGAYDRYIDAGLLVKARMHYDMTQPLYCWKIIEFLDIHIRDHSYVIEDVCLAVAAISLFFPSPFLTDDAEGRLWADSKLFDRTWRASNLTDRRTPLSNKHLPPNFWHAWDAVSPSITTSSLPIPEAKCIRGAIATLYHHGVIQASSVSDPDLQVAACREPHNGRDKLDMYIDDRGATHLPSTPNPNLTDPEKVDLLGAVRNFLSTLDSPEEARFALLRIWSAPHFWPLMLGFDARPAMAFADAEGRSWEYRFLPKDVGPTAWSIHHAVKQRILPYEDMLSGKRRGGGRGPVGFVDKRGIWMDSVPRELGEGREPGNVKVLVRKDMLLVMGANEEELRLLATAVTYCVQTRPWRLEIDLWRSFVNVGIEELEDLGKKGWIW